MKCIPGHGWRLFQVLLNQVNRHANSDLQDKFFLRPKCIPIIAILFATTNKGILVICMFYQLFGGFQASKAFEDQAFVQKEIKSPYRQTNFHLRATSTKVKYKYFRLIGILTNKWLI